MCEDAKCVQVRERWSHDTRVARGVDRSLDLDELGVLGMLPELLELLIELMLNEGDTLETGNTLAGGS